MANRQGRLVEITIKLPMNFPVDWSDEDINFFLNDSSWCFDNIIRELENYSKENGCICNICEGKVLPAETLKSIDYDAATPGACATEEYSDYDRPTFNGGVAEEYSEYDRNSDDGFGFLWGA